MEEMEENKVEAILRDAGEPCSFDPRDLDHLPRREATDLTPEEFAETIVTEWSPEH